MVVSVFVNPTQFAPNEDYDIYPRDLERDAELAREAGCDFLFAPSAEEMYPAGYRTYVNVEEITEKLCGASRPSHFRGVTTVVSKLFNITRPAGIFRPKDAQQALVIMAMTSDLNFPVEIRTVPTVREADGLALSSRNTYLRPDERKAAPVLFRSLQAARSLFLQGKGGGRRFWQQQKKVLAEEPKTQVEYLSLVHPLTLEEVERVEKQALLALAVRIGKVRLIDNLMLGSGLVEWEEDDYAQDNV